MEGPLDPQHPGQDAGASQPEAQDGDLHALLERLLGQGDVRPSAPGAGDDLWPDVFASAPAADEVSTIVPAPDAPVSRRRAPDRGRGAVDERRGGVELAPARAWEPVVVDDAATTTNVDDIHAAILASVSVELEPIVAAPSAPQPEPRTRPVPLRRRSNPSRAASIAEPPSLDALLDAALPLDATTTRRGRRRPVVRRPVARRRVVRRRPVRRAVVVRRRRGRPFEPAVDRRSTGEPAAPRRSR